MPKRDYRRPPTLKQIKAVQYMNQGMTKRQALLKAGYSIAVASHPTKFFMERKGVKRMLSTMVGELADAGLTTTYMVNKFKEWLEAEGVGGPDYTTQLAAYREWKKITDADQAENNPGNHQVKRKLTIEEFIDNGQEEQSEGGGE